MRVYSETQTVPEATIASTIINPPLHNVIPDITNPDVKQTLELENDDKDREFEEQQVLYNAKRQGQIDIEKLRIALIGASQLGQMVGKCLDIASSVGGALSSFGNGDVGGAINSAKSALNTYGGAGTIDKVQKGIGDFVSSILQ